MNQVRISDTTLCRESGRFSFKEKIEIARQLEKLRVDKIELPAVENVKTDVLLVRTVSSFVKSATLSVAAGESTESVDNAAAALSASAHKSIRIELPLSPVGMEYTCHKKPPKMLEWIAKIVSYAREKCDNVEFCAIDATRAEPDFLNRALTTAAASGAAEITVCDSAARLLPDDFAAFLSEIVQVVHCPVGVRCNNRNGLAAAQAILAVRAGVCEVKTAIEGDTVPLETMVGILRDCGDNYQLASGIAYTEVNRIIRQISRIVGVERYENGRQPLPAADASFSFDEKDDITVIGAAVASLGYELSDEDNVRVYEEFRRVAAKKKVGARELDAIVASVALQVPASYTLENYVINNGNIISSSAQITLCRDGKTMQGVCLGDGPIDAAFHAMEQIIGHHYELDDFQIQAVTEGKEAMGAALVKLRAGGKLYSGNGISTDIIGASIRAYLGAVNKIVYEEN